MPSDRPTLVWLLQHAYDVHWFRQQAGSFACWALKWPSDCKTMDWLNMHLRTD
jgi:hypothetical protein